MSVNVVKAPLSNLGVLYEREWPAADIHKWLGLEERWLGMRLWRRRWNWLRRVSRVHPADHVWLRVVDRWRWGLPPLPARALALAQLDTIGLERTAWARAIVLGTVTRVIPVALRERGWTKRADVLASAADLFDAARAAKDASVVRRSALGRKDWLCGALQSAYLAAASASRGDSVCAAWQAARATDDALNIYCAGGGLWDEYRGLAHFRAEVEAVGLDAYRAEGRA